MAPPPSASMPVEMDPGLAPGLLVASAAPGNPLPGTTTEEPGFVPTAGGDEGASASSLLVTAYLLMWAALFLFVLLGYRRQWSLARRVEHLEQALAKHSGDEGEGDS